MLQSTDWFEKKSKYQNVNWLITVLNKACCVSVDENDSMQRSVCMFLLLWISVLGPCSTFHLDVKVVQLFRIFLCRLWFCWRKRSPSNRRECWTTVGLIFFCFQISRMVVAGSWIWPVTSPEGAIIQVGYIQFILLPDIWIDISNVFKKKPV